MTEVLISALKEEDFTPKWYLNGFPKSGMHWIALMMIPIAEPLFDDHNLWSVPWAGTFTGNSWTLNSVPLERVAYKIGRLRDGYFFKGHSAYSDELERFLWYLGISAIFIYRDLRDVAVSQAFHVISENDDLMSHPDKDIYKKMDTFDEVLEAVIKGIDVYPGVLDRWPHYAGWLDAEWVCKIRYEDLIKDPHREAIRILKHGLGRVSTVFGLKPDIKEDNLNIVAGWMVEAGKRTDKSPTFRKGSTGDWREYFTPEISRLFAELDDGWLEHLGYAEEGWWK